MEVNYADGWFRAGKSPGAALTIEQARTAFEIRGHYAAILGPLVHPVAFIEFNRDYVGVGFLDSRLREYLSYTFIENESNRLFLEEATYREFHEGSDTVRKGTTYIFRKDGSVTVVRQDIECHTTSTSQQQYDPSKNWEVYPEFGRFESLLRVER